MGRHHARVLGLLDGVDLVGVADPAGDPQGVAHGVPVFTSLDALLTTGIDYCVVAVPTQWHEAVGSTLADAGVHALIEKPVAADSASASRLADRFEAAGLVGAVGHIERFNPALQQLQSRLEAGDIGDIFQIATRRQGPFPGRIADVGVVMDLASHDIDLTMYVSGQQFNSVSAHTAHQSGRDHEDLVAISATLSDGLITNHLVNWLSPMKERVTVVTGERGTFIADTLAGDLTFHANGTVTSQWADIAHFRGMTEGDVTRFAYPKPEPLRTEHESFRDAVLGKEACIVSLRDGLITVQVAEAVLRSASSGSTERIATRLERAAAPESALEPESPTAVELVTDRG